MRRSFDGLSAVVKTELGGDPLSGEWFVFINRRRTLLKVLAYEEGGYCVWAKRLEAGQFARSGVGTGGKRRLSGMGLLALIEGVDMVIKRHRKRYKKAV